MSGQVISDYRLEMAMREIKDKYGDDVIIKPKTLNKFGQNTDVDSADGDTWIMELQGSEVRETLVDGNLITHAVSSNNSDTFQLYIEGQTGTGTGASHQKTFVSQTVTLTGQTPVALATPICRATRLENNSATAQQANSVVYVYEGTSSVTNGVPDTSSKVHIVMQQSQTNNRSLKAATAFSNSDYGILTYLYVAVNKKTTALVDFKLKIQQPGKVPYTVFSPFTLNSTAQSSLFIPLNPYVIVPKNSDVFVTAATSADNTSVSAAFGNYFGLVNANIGIGSRR